jgi:radical SAM protein with 4Fe4S-binding SPASM domain
MADNRIHHVTIPGLRLHLRRGDPNMLWLNGQNLLLLNETAAEFVDAFIDTMSHYEENMNTDKFRHEIVAHMHQKYPQVPDAILLKDFDSVYAHFTAVSQGNCPISELQLDTKEINPQTWVAPPRMDLALTYRCNNNCYFCYTGGPHNSKELSTNEWKKIIDTLWNNGIPQIIFTGGEPTLCDDLIELVDYAREFVTGLITDGRKLKNIAGDLHRVSLDYIQVSMESHLPVIHDKMVGVNGAWKETTDGIKAALSNHLEVITNTTITRDNAASFSDTINAGADLGLKMMACNTLLCSGRGTCAKQDSGIPLSEIKTVLTKAQEAAAKSGIRLEWYSPTCYKQFNPLDFGFGAKSCSAAQYNMTVEPDGQVIPCQSWLKDKLGNVLTDSWSSIWNNPVALNLRNRKYLEGRKECQECDYLEDCHGGCPLEYSL